MYINIKEILGLWRGNIGGDIVDLYIREFNEKINKGRSLFTIYSIDSGKIIFEWQAQPKFILNKEGTNDVHLDHLITTDIKSEFLKVEVWSLGEDHMTLKYEDGYKIELRKIK